MSDFSDAGAAGNTTVQFVDVSAGVSDQNVGFFDSIDYCQSDPQVAVTTFYDSQSSGSAATQAAFGALAL
ncbi:MAG: hypothetical protein R2867_16255 [Caldilineaceae bacterium]